MTDWKKITETMFESTIGPFRYTVDPVDGQFHWSLDVSGQYICQDGPFGLEKAKTEAQKDYTARISQAQRIISRGRYTE